MTLRVYKMPISLRFGAARVAFDRIMNRNTIIPFITRFAGCRAVPSVVVEVAA